jgi:hypothetical protein
MQNMFENPQVEEVFGKLMQFKEGGQGEEEVKATLPKNKMDISDEEDEDPFKRDEKQKADIIRTFALN